jgi:phosphotransacetylase
MRADAGEDVMSDKTGTGKYKQLLARCRRRRVEPVPAAGAHRCERTALEEAIEAAGMGLIVPILGGPAATIREVAERNGIDLGRTRIVDALHSHAAVARDVALVRQGEAEVLMNGSLHSDKLLGAVVARETGLRTGRRISHAFIMDVPTYHKVLVVRVPIFLTSRADSVRSRIASGAVATLTAHTRRQTLQAVT